MSINWALMTSSIILLRKCTTKMSNGNVEGLTVYYFSSHWPMFHLDQMVMRMLYI